jgi:hypothetical protein
MIPTPKPNTVLPQMAAWILGCAACSAPHHATRGSEAPAPPAASAEVPAPKPIPWTDAFQKSAALVANDVRIEGPVGLIAHVATVSNPEELDRSEKTVPEGFLQVVSVKPGFSGVEIKAQLDRLAIVALGRLTILERVGPADVVVIATGDAYWANPESGEEKRAATLRFDGKIAR